jgi:hypothetical protein
VLAGDPRVPPAVHRRLDEPVRLAELDRLRVHQRRLRVHPVRLPDRPRVIVGVLILPEPEALHLQPSRRARHDDLAPVVAHRRQQRPERLPELRGRERHRVTALEVLVEDAHPRPPGIEALLK